MYLDDGCGVRICGNKGQYGMLDTQGPSPKSELWRRESSLLKMCSILMPEEFAMATLWSQRAMTLTNNPGISCKTAIKYPEGQLLIGPNMNLI